MHFECIYNTKMKMKIAVMTLQCNVKTMHLKMLIYLEASWMCQSWCPFCSQDFCASDLKALAKAHPNPHLPAAHTGNTGNYRSFLEEQQWDLGDVQAQNW